MAPTVEAAALAPPLKWAGGKRWLVPRLAKLRRGHEERRLVEPFVGGLAVPLGLRPKRALLNDLNPHLIAFYRHLQRGLDPSRTGVAFENDRTAYDANRDRFNALIRAGKADSEEGAALFYYLNRTGFNGLCRFNASGAFNVPFGRHRLIPYRRTAADFEEYVRRLERYEFFCGDFASLKIRPDDFIYADPPYDVEFTAYSAGGFGWSEQERLAHWLARHRGPVVASNQATSRIVKMYRGLGFDLIVLTAPRKISCNGDRTKAKEILAFKNLQPRRTCTLSQLGADCG